jgi:signal transduction histidine kinase
MSGTHTDITERKATEEALARHDRAMAALYETSLEINSQPNVPTLLHAIVRRAAELLGTRMGGLYLMRPDDQALELVVSHNLPRDYAGTLLHLGEGLSGRIAQTGKPMMVDDHLHWDGRAGVYADMQTRRVLGVPLKVGDRAIGVINVADDQKVGPFDEDQVRLLSLFADQAAVAVENTRLVEALRQQTTELQARNEELDAFAHTVAHDLKTPLSLIIGHAGLLQDYAAMSSDDQLHHSLHLMIQNARKMSSIIDDLLLLAETRSAEVDRKPLDMVSIVSEAQQRLADVAEQSHAEIVLLDVSTWPVALGYAPWVEEVWANYLSNALKYGGQPPCIELGASPLPNPSPLAGEGGGRVRFWVRDNGVGLTPEDQARLFTPFTRLDQVHVKGHGLGLSIVRRIVEKLGGEVGVESQVGQGSTFSFTLPGVPG